MHRTITKPTASKSCGVTVIVSAKWSDSFNRLHGRPAGRSCFVHGLYAMVHQSGRIDDHSSSRAASKHEAVSSWASVFRLPEMSGPEFYAKLTASEPANPMIFMTSQAPRNGTSVWRKRLPWPICTILLTSSTEILSSCSLQRSMHRSFSPLQEPQPIGSRRPFPKLKKRA